MKYNALFLIPGYAWWAEKKKNIGLHLFFYHVVWILVLIPRYDLIIKGFRQLDFELLTAPLLFIIIYTCSVYFPWKNYCNPALSEIGKSPWNLALKRFKNNKLAYYAFFLIIYIYSLVILAPYVSPYDPMAIDNVLDSRYLPPSLSHPFGTDEFGRDILSRTLFGGRISLTIGFLAVIIAMSIGTLYGTVSAYFGGWTDNLLMRGVDILMAFPVFFLMITMVAVFEVTIPVMVLIMGLTSWMGTARYIRGEVLSLKNLEYIESAKAIGLPDRIIILHHLIPNAMTPVLVSSALMVGGMISMEAGLSFLGIGIQPPVPTWGNMIGDGTETLIIAWWIAFFPGLMLSITIICFNLIADGLRDALSPKSIYKELG